MTIRRLQWPLAGIAAAALAGCGGADNPGATPVSTVSAAGGGSPPVTQTTKTIGGPWKEMPNPVELSNYPDRALVDRAASIAATDASLGSPVGAAPDVIAIRASGTSFNGAPARLQVRVDGRTLATVPVAVGEQPATILVSAGAPIAAGARVDVAFVNDAWDESSREDRNLNVESITINGRTIAAGDAGVVYDRGSGDAAYDGVDTGPGQPMLWVDASLRFTAPTPQTPPSSSDLAVRPRLDALARVNRMLALEVPAWEALKMFVPAEGTRSNKWSNGVVTTPVVPTLSPMLGPARVCPGGGSFSLDIDGVPLTEGQQPVETATAVGSQSGGTITLKAGLMNVRFDHCVDGALTLDGTVRTTYSFENTVGIGNLRQTAVYRSMADQTLDLTATLAGRAPVHWKGGLRSTYEFGDKAETGRISTHRLYGDHQYLFNRLERTSEGQETEIWNGELKRSWADDTLLDLASKSGSITDNGLSVSVGQTGNQARYQVTGGWDRTGQLSVPSDRHPRSTVTVTGDGVPTGALDADPLAASGALRPDGVPLIEPMYREIDGHFYRY